MTLAGASSVLSSAQLSDYGGIIMTQEAGASYILNLSDGHKEALKKASISGMKSFISQASKDLSPIKIEVKQNDQQDNTN